MDVNSRRALQLAFASHPRRWRDYRYVYPVISRRSRGLSIGVNLNPDTACNFDCIYCSVDRTTPPRYATLDLAILAEELREICANHAALFHQPEFRDIAPEYQRLNDIAFSGDGEPTAVPEFAPAGRLAAEVRAALGLSAKIVIITDACYLTRPAVAATLDYLDPHGLAVWAKLDAGTEAYFRRVNRPNVPLEHVLQNIAACARVRPVVLQSLFLRIDGAAPPPEEVEAYVRRVGELLAGGARLAAVQVYTVARRTAEPFATRLTADELEEIAARIRALGVPAEVYP